MAAVEGVGEEAMMEMERRVNRVYIDWMMNVWIAIDEFPLVNWWWRFVMVIEESLSSK